MKLQILVVLSSLSLSPSMFAQEMSGGSTGTALTSAGSTALAPAYEATCRIKAKEVAASIFKTCMSDGKSAQLEAIRKEYQEQLSQVRAGYEQELERLSKAKKERESQDAETTRQELKKTASPDTAKSTKQSSTMVKMVSAKVNGKSLPVKSSSKSKSVAFTKKGLPLKSVKSVLTEMKSNSEADSSKSNSITEMAITLKPATAVAIADESVQDIPEPIAITTDDVKLEKIQEQILEAPETSSIAKPVKIQETATIQLD